VGTAPSTRRVLQCRDLRQKSRAVTRVVPGVLAALTTGWSRPRRPSERYRLRGTRRRIEPRPARTPACRGTSVESAFYRARGVVSLEEQVCLFRIRGPCRTLACWSTAVAARGYERVRGAWIPSATS